MPLSEEKSIELARAIDFMKLPLTGVDIEYAKEVYNAMNENDGRYQTMAALNRDYSPEHGNFIKAQTEALGLIIKLIEKLKECDALKRLDVSSKVLLVKFDKESGYYFVHPGIMEQSAFDAFQKLWISINGQENWDSNPWVWVIEFEKQN